MENSVQLVINDTLTIDGFMFEERLQVPDGEYAGDPYIEFFFRGYVGPENNLLATLKNYPIIVNIKVLNKENGEVIFKSEAYEKIYNASNRFNRVGAQYVFELSIGE